MAGLRRLLDALRAYLANPDPLAAGANRIALVVAGNQPFYPLYLWWLVGGSWQVSLLTWLSTPLFCAVPWAARNDPRYGTTLLVIAGVANGALSAKAFGTASAVEMFLIPCALIAALGFRVANWRWSVALLALVGAAAALHGAYGVPLGHFSPLAYTHFANLNRWSVLTLSALILWTLSPPHWRRA